MPELDPATARIPNQPALTLMRDHWGWFVAAAAVLALMIFLGPILTPFVVGATFAYLGDPLVDRLEKLRMSRSVAVSLLFVVVTAITVITLVLLVPLLQEQIATLVQNIPQWLKWLQEVGLPALGAKLPRGVHLDADGLGKMLSEHWSSAGDFVSAVLNYVGRSTPALLGFFADLLLIPIVTFYLLRDWDVMVARIRELTPLHLQPQARAFTDETDGVLSALIRGQLLVMLALAVLYSAGLWFAGLKLALLIGIMAGLVSFVPYLGFISGLLAASIAMLVQTQELLPVVWVLLVFGVGAFFENGILVPLLVGDRIGLHPVTVIFAILAGGQLFGFTGVLLALPVAAVLAVVARHALRRWQSSPLYLGQAPPAASEPMAAKQAPAAPSIVL